MKILLIEGSDTVSERVAALIALTNRYQVLARTHSVSDALPWLEDDHPHAILLALHPDKEDSLRLLQIIRDKTLSIPVVVLSIFDDCAYRRRAISQGAAEFLSKTTQFEHIIPTLDRLLMPPGLASDDWQPKDLLK